MTRLRQFALALGAVDVLLYAFVGLAIWSLAANVDPVAEIEGWMMSQLQPPANDSATSFAVEVSR